MRYPIAHPYKKLRVFYLLNKKTISLRKLFCLQYLKWGVTQTKEDRDAFVDMAKRWRKEDKRVGKHRTLLERKARKLFRKVAIERNRQACHKGASKWGKRAKRKQIGFHSPEHKARIVEHNRRISKLCKEKNLYFAKNWIVYSPTGEVFRVRGLRQLCREFGLDHGHLGATHKRPGKTHKGWRVEQVSDDWESI